jgi:hypothetical protein
MAEKVVPYFSPAQRTTGVAFAAMAMLAGILIARLTIDEDDLLTFFLVALGPMLLALAIWRIWYGRNNPRMTRSELQKRYAIEALEAPYWQALTIHGCSPVMAMMAITALHSPSIAYAAEALAITLPIGLLLAAVTLHFVRREQQRFLDKA